MSNTWIRVQSMIIVCLILRLGRSNRRTCDKLLYLYSLNTSSPTKGEHADTHIFLGCTVHTCIYVYISLGWDFSGDQLTNMTDGSQQHSSRRQQQHRAARLGVVHVQDTRESTLLAQKHRVLLFLLFAFFVSDGLREPDR